MRNSDVLIDNINSKTLEESYRAANEDAAFVTNALSYGYKVSHRHILLLCRPCLVEYRDNKIISDDVAEYLKGKHIVMNLASDRSKHVVCRIKRVDRADKFKVHCIIATNVENEAVHDIVKGIKYILMTLDISRHEVKELKLNGDNLRFDYIVE